MTGSAEAVPLAKTNYRAAFESLLKARKGRQPAWLSSIRSEAFQNFARLGFPSRDHEEWRYTDVGPIVESAFRFQFEPVREAISLGKLEMGHKDWHRLVFVNGIYSKDLSSTETLPEGVKVESLQQALKDDSIVAEEYLGKYAACEREAFSALNTAFIHDGALIFIPKGKAVERPIHLLFVSHSSDGPLIVQPRNLIVVGEGAQATVVESYLALEDHAYFTNTVTEVVLSPGARLDYYKDEKESVNAYHVGSVQVHEERGSRFQSTAIALGARLSRNNLNVILDAEGAECDLKGLYFVTGRQLVDHHSVIDHRKPRGTSRQLYKGILDGEASGVFSGKIFIRPDAQKSDTQQVNKNLLLSEGSKVDTKPQLEIFADDVKATHGAAVGQLDEEEIFYLKSRGMGESSARALLTFGFANELIEKIKLEPIRWELDRIFWNRLQG